MIFREFLEGKLFVQSLMKLGIFVLQGFASRPFDQKFEFFKLTGLERKSKAPFHCLHGHVHLAIGGHQDAMGEVGC